MELEFLQSKTGSRVARYGGRQLSSFIDPEREALVWVDHYAQNFKRKKAVVVLGLACGHHIRTLKNVFKGKIYVVELIEELRTKWVEENQDPDIHVSGVEEFKKIVVEGTLILPLGVLTFAPALVTDLSVYKDLYDTLSGRSVNALHKQFELRGQSHFFIPSNLNFNDPRESYRKLAQSEGLEHRWRSLFQLLGEVVK